MFVALATAAVYTKQTIGCVLIALLINFLINHRDRIGSRRLWTAAAAVFVPVAAAAGADADRWSPQHHQSIGSREAAATRGVIGMDRWSIPSWLFYPSLLVGMSPLLVVVGAIGAITAWRDRVFLKSNALWFAWIVVWYVCFSYFINKQPRFMTLWIPPWVALTMAVVAGQVPAGRAPALVVCRAGPGDCHQCSRRVHRRGARVYWNGPGDRRPGRVRREREHCVLWAVPSNLCTICPPVGLDAPDLRVARGEDPRDGLQCR